MKASVDDSRCRGHGVCTTICPQVFALTDDGYAEVIVDEVPESARRQRPRGGRGLPGERHHLELGVAG